MAPLHAVLTGDLIHSQRSSAAQVDDTMALIEAAARRIVPAARFHRYRGDGWQVHLGPARDGLRTMVHIAAQLGRDEGLASRIALGLGDAFGLDRQSLASAGGGAFVASGRALDAMTAGHRLALAGAGVDPLHQALVAYIDVQAQGWSPAQAEAVALALAADPGTPHLALAAELAISRQAFAARLSAAGYELVIEALAAFSLRFADGAADG